MCSFAISVLVQHLLQSLLLRLYVFLPTTMAPSHVRLVDHLALGTGPLHHQLLQLYMLLLVLVVLETLQLMKLLHLQIILLLE